MEDIRRARVEQPGRLLDQVIKGDHVNVVILFALRQALRVQTLVNNFVNIEFATKAFI